MSDIHNQLLDLVSEANLSNRELDFIKRLLIKKPDYLASIVKYNFNNSPSDFASFLATGKKPKPDIYSEIPNTLEAKHHLLKSIKSSKVYFYSDSDNDGKHALAMFNIFSKAIDWTPEVATLADITIKSIDTSIPNTSHHGLNSNQFIADFIKNPNEGPITIMTADNGMSSQPDIDAIREFCAERDIKVDFLITDHHLPDPDSATIPADDVTVLNLELNKNHGRYTLSGAQTTGGLLNAVLADLTDDDIAMEHGVKPVPQRRCNQATKLIITAGERSAVADIVNDGSHLSAEDLEIATQQSSIHNKIRGFDFFLKNLPKGSKYEFEANEINQVSNNFLTNINKSPSVISSNLYNKSSADIGGGFTSLPHIQATLLEISVKIQNKVATRDEWDKHELFNEHIMVRLTAFRNKVISELRSNAGDYVEFSNTDLFNFKSLKDPSLSTAFANQVFPPPSKEVTLTVRPMDRSTNIISGSFRSANLKLQDLLTPSLAKNFESFSITDQTIKGHALAAGFKCKVDPSVKNPDKIIFDIFSKEISNQFEIEMSNEKPTIPQLNKRDLALFKGIQPILGITSRKGDFDLLVTGEAGAASSLEDLVIQHNGTNVLLGDLDFNKETGINGFVKSEYSLAPSTKIDKELGFSSSSKAMIISGLDIINENSIMVSGSSQFSKIVNSNNFNLVTIPESSIDTAITKMDNTFSEIIPASEFMNNHALGKSKYYLRQIEDEIRSGNTDSISELDVEASELGKAPALTNVGILTFFIDKDTDILMMERNSFLVKSPKVISNANENLTEITNKSLREKGISTDEASDVLVKLFSSGNHEIRAFNGRYDLGVLQSNLDDRVLSMLQNNIVFTDTLRVAKSFNAGSWSSDRYIDIVDNSRGTSGIKVLKGARLEDFEKFKEGSLQSISSVSTGETLAYSARNTNNLSYVKSMNSTNSVQSILAWLMANNIFPEDPFAFKQLSKFKSRTHILRNIDEIAIKIGLDKEKILLILDRLDHFNSNPNPTQKKVMDRMGLTKTEQLYDEKHNNLDELGDIHLEGVGLMICLEKLGISYEDIQKAFTRANEGSRISNMPSLMASSSPTNAFHVKQLRDIGKDVYDNTTVLHDIASPLKKPKSFIVEANVDNLQPQDKIVIQTLTNLHFMDLSSTKEYQALNDYLEENEILFRPWTDTASIMTILNKISENASPMKYKNARAKLKKSFYKQEDLKHLMDNINMDDSETNELLSEVGTPEFNSFDYYLPKPLNKKDANWKKIVPHQYRAKQSKTLSEARVLLNDMNFADNKSQKSQNRFTA